MTRLSRIRHQLRLTQTAAARLLGIARQSYAEQEKRGIRNTDRAVRYAAVLGCDPRDLLEFANKQHSNKRRSLKMEKELTALRKMRMSRFLSQTELAQKLGVRPNNISMMEQKGIQQIKTAERYAEVLQCRPEELMEFTSLHRAKQTTKFRGRQ